MSPLFFIGLAAIALPIIAHLISRKSGIKQTFPALTFLLSSQGDLATRSRIKDLILLLLRALILVFIVLIFAKPAVFSFSKSTDSSPRSVAIVVDNSFSMGYEDYYEKALGQASKLIDILPDGSFGLVAPLVASGDDQYTSTQDKNSLKQDVKDIELSYSFANNEDRLQDIYSKLQLSPNEKKVVVLITDLQKNGWESQNFEPSWLELVDVSDKKASSNHAVTDIDLNLGDNFTDILTDVSNFSDSPVTDLLVTVNFNKKDITEKIDIDPNYFTTVDVSFDYNDQDSSGSVETQNDKLKIDDTRYFISDGSNSDSKILIVDGDPREDSRLSETYFLARALETISEKADAQITILDNERFLNEDLSNYDIIYLANVGDITPTLAKELEGFANSGGSIVVFLGNAVRASSYNTLFKNILPARINSEFENEISLTTQDSSLFSTQIADKIKQITVERMFDTTVDQEANIILSTDQGKPFLIQSTYGSGSVFLFTSTADTSWTNFSITPVFLPVINKIHDLPNIERNKARHFFIGDSVKIDSAQNGGNIEILDPNGKRHQIKAENDLYEKTYVPGIYTVISGDQDNYQFAVNISPAESNLQKIRPSLSEDTESETQGFVKVFREIWRYFLWGVIALFVSESVFRSLFS
ncbi:MAG: BatA domain-containing protein [Thermodesulfobacteriota bacterium]